MATILIVEDEKAIFNASLFVKKGIGYAIALDKIINTTGDSEPCFLRLLKSEWENGI